LLNEVGLYVVQGRIHKLKNCVNSRPKSVFKDQEAVKCLSSLHDKYLIVPADKASNNIVFVCKSYYFECLIKELGINSNTSSNTTYKPTSFNKDEILANHRSFMTSLNIPSGKESEDTRTLTQDLGLLLSLSTFWHNLPQHP
jgi:hypothetical protein